MALEFWLLRCNCRRWVQSVPHYCSLLPVPHVTCSASKDMPKRRTLGKAGRALFPSTSLCSIIHDTNNCQLVNSHPRIQQSIVILFDKSPSPPPTHTQTSVMDWLHTYLQGQRQTVLYPVPWRERPPSQGTWTSPRRKRRNNCGWHGDSDSTPAVPWPQTQANQGEGETVLGLSL